MSKEGTVENSYWTGFDYIKGICVILVFLGHIIPGQISTSFVRYIIYSVHMPIFIGISGFLFDIEKFNTNLAINIKKYWERPIRPWMVAVLCYFIIRILLGEVSPSLVSFAKAFILPYYHLWYVVGFLSWIVIVLILWNVFKKFNNRWIHVLLISTLITLVYAYIYIYNLELCNDGILHYIIVFKQHSFRLFYLIFFVLGVFLRNCYKHGKESITNRVLIGCKIILVISGIITIIRFVFGYTNVININNYIMNCALMVICIYACVKNKTPRNKWLEFLGKYSLPIYLYHVLCKMIAQIVFIPGSVGYYLVCCISFVVLCVGIYYLRLNDIINYYILGSASNKPLKR